MNIQWHLTLFLRLPAWLIVSGVVLLAVPGVVAVIGHSMVGIGLALFIVHPDRHREYAGIAPLLIVPLIATMSPSLLPAYSSGILHLGIVLLFWLSLTLGCAALTKYILRITAARQKGNTPPAIPITK